MKDGFLIPSGDGILFQGRAPDVAPSTTTAFFVSNNRFAHARLCPFRHVQCIG